VFCVVVLLLNWQLIALIMLMMDHAISAGFCCILHHLMFVEFLCRSNCSLLFLKWFEYRGHFVLYFVLCSEHRSNQEFEESTTGLLGSLKSFASGIKSFWKSL
jgi:hypothetical protein